MSTRKVELVFSRTKCLCDDEVSLLQQILFRQAVQLFLTTQKAIMDCVKVYDSQLTHRNNSSLLQFLDRKQKSRSADNVSVYTEDLDTQPNQPTRLCPHFSFTFTTYQISDYVQYNVILNEKYKILGRTVIKKYEFKTRYSMLEALDTKLGGKGLPGKKIFGNKNPSFIQKRKIDLENYLNRVAYSGSTEFYAFIQQIKDNQFNVSLNQSFSIE